MNTTQDHPPMRWRTRLAGVLVCAAFALAFGGVGLMATRQIGAICHAAWQARHWQPVPVEVLSAALQGRRDADGDTHDALEARYRYEWMGRSYESTQVRLPGGMGHDNFDPWQRDWELRLNRARDSEERLVAWVDPDHPEIAVLDRRLRWRQLLFMLPFSIVFSLIGAAAFGAGWLMVRSRTTEAAVARQAQPAPPQQALGAWSIAIFWCGIAFPVAGLVWGATAPAWVSLMMGAFVWVGLALLWSGVKTSRQAWTYRGATVQFQPSQPLAGASFTVSWRLPARAAAHWRAEGRWCLRLAQVRIDDSNSGNAERRVEEISAHAEATPGGDGSLLLKARFDLPVDAPSQSSRRSGEKVDWRLECVDAAGVAAWSLTVPVRGDAMTSVAAPDRFAPSTSGTEEADIPPEDATDEMPDRPANVRLIEGDMALSLRFPVTSWRCLGGLALLGAIGLSMPSAAAFSLSELGLAGALLALALHALSFRWALAVADDGLCLERGSWMWRTVFSLPTDSLDRLFRRSNLRGGRAGHGVLLTRWPTATDGLRLTPGLPQFGDAVRIARLLRWAAAQRRGRFSPGGQRTSPRRLSRPRWGWLLWAALMLAMAQGWIG